MHSLRLTQRQTVDVYISYSKRVVSKRFEMVYFFPDWATLIDLRPGYDETTNVYLKITDAENKQTKQKTTKNNNMGLWFLL